MLLVGGGSNLVVADEGYAGRVVVVRNVGMRVESDLCGGAYVEIGAGHNWDDVVAEAVANGWVGVEALSGIPGTTGATPIQNVGAYGQEISQTLARVRTWDRKLEASAPSRQPTATSATAPAGSSGTPDASSYWASPSSSASVTSALPCSTPSWPVLSASRPASGLRPARCATLSSPCAAARPWCSTPRTTTPGAPARSSPTRSSPADVVPDGAPTWPQPDGLVKTSAAWLIEQAGFTKGYGTDRVRLSSRHTLAITNRGGGHHRRAAGPCPRAPGGRRAAFRDHPGQRAGAGRLPALSCWPPLDRAATWWSTPRRPRWR